MYATIFLRSFAAIGLLTAHASLLPAQDPGVDRPGPRYHLAVGRTYNQHAADGMRILKKVAATSQAVSPDIVAEHFAMARNNLHAAQKSFEKVNASGAGQGDVRGQITTIQRRLVDLDKQLNQLETQTSERDVSSQRLLDRITTLLQQAEANDVDANQADRSFYDVNSPDYYDTGKGHFDD